MMPYKIPKRDSPSSLDSRATASEALMKASKKDIEVAELMTKGMDQTNRLERRTKRRKEKKDGVNGILNPDIRVRTRVQIP